MPSVAICGAGPAGLTLARLLQQANVPDLNITVFEKDTSPTSRFYQGGCLDLHPTTGLAAIRKAGLWNEFFEFARYEGEELLFSDKNATVFVHTKEAPKIEGSEARPEIDREKLKEILLNSVSPQTLQWGKHLRSVDAETGLLAFADGSTAGPFDLVVGADGAWSRVRAVLSDIKPMYSGICGLGANVNKTSAGEHWDAISRMVGKGSYFSYSDGKGVNAQKMGDGSLRLGIWSKREQSWPADLVDRNGGDENKIKQALLEEFSDWEKSLKLWIRTATQFQPWPLFELPIGHRWEHRKGWTLIGDSAHLMTPFAGEGVNAAMRDALDLSEAILTACQGNGPSLDEAITKFEQEMFPRNEKVQLETDFNKVRMFRSDAPIGFIVDMIEVAAGQAGYDISTGWLSWLPIKRTASVYLETISRFGIFRRWVQENVFGG